MTSEEIEAALAFDFPQVREMEVQLVYGAVAVHCGCGETTNGTAASWAEHTINCVCGRIWKITLIAELIREPGRNGASSGKRQVPHETLPSGAPSPQGG